MTNTQRKNQLTRIMVFGTFDVLHKGHEHFFKQAKALAKNSFLIVSIARDVNVKKIKGKKPLLSEQARAKLVRRLGVANKVVLGGHKNFVDHIVKERPNIIALGYDQVAYTEDLEKKLLKKGLSVQIKILKPHKPHVYKSSFMKEKMGLRMV